jgi:hypothetical protein
MFVFPLKKNQLENKLTIFFLIIFILIKASPYYYLYQYPSQFKGADTNESFRVRKSDDHHNFLVKVDKSIDEKGDHPIIPQIKFTGIPFDIFFLGIFFVFLIPTNNSLFNYLLNRNEVCIAQCILRL